MYLHMTLLVCVHSMSYNDLPNITVHSANENASPQANTSTARLKVAEGPTLNVTRLRHTR